MYLFQYDESEHSSREGSQFQKITLVKTTTSRDHVSKTQHFCYVFFAKC